MNYNYCFRNSTDALPTLLEELETVGDEITSRAGVTKEMMHVGITLTNPLERELLVPERKPNLAAQIAETAWVLAGRKDIEWLSHYLPRAADFSDDGKTWRAGYGPRMRKWAGRAGGTPDPVDQLAYVVDTLRSAPASRQAVISLWDPAVDTAPGKDLPCNDWLNFSSRHGRLDLHVAVRSNDVMWGWSGINAFEWSVLQEVVAELLGLSVGALHFSTTSFHLYDRHFRKAYDIIRAEPAYMKPMKPSPRFNIWADPTLSYFDELLTQWFRAEEAIRTGQTVFVDDFPEPMLRSWLRVLQWWWSGDEKYLEPLRGTRLHAATQYSVQPEAVSPTYRQDLDAALKKIHSGWEPDVKVLKQGVPENSTSGLQVGSACPKCGTVMTTSGGRTPLKCIAAVCNYTPSEPFFIPAQQVEVSTPLPPYQPETFIDYVCNLHDEKHRAYGDSWKRRGELLGILANIARKVDRLGTGGETSDETSADTAIDLFVYLAKYSVWLEEQRPGVPPDAVASDSTSAANDVMRYTVTVCGSEVTDDVLAKRLSGNLDVLERMATGRSGNKIGIAQAMLLDAAELAQRRWAAEQGDTYRGADHD